ncbi:MAG: adenylate/guanylate cyclase domain-containing protein [Desulfobacterales bacterium]|nr:adenylate/guanylate cyclase domain-containing protein [Desulfobacterales bacterium]
MKKLLKLSPLKLSILITVAGIAAYMAGIPFLDLMELKTLDLRFRSRGKAAPAEQVVLAVIDEKSINTEGKWVWPRSKMARLISKLSAAGARVTAFDIGFLEPDDQRVVNAISQIQADMGSEIKTGRMQAYLNDLKLRSDEDRLLARAIESSKSKVVLGYFFHMGQSELAHVDEKTIQIHQENILSGGYKFVRYASPESQQSDFITATLPQSNITTIATATPYSGYFNMFPDPDGVVRWIPAVIKFKDSLFAPLSMMAASAYLDEPLSVKVGDIGVESVDIGTLWVPTDEIGRVLINYHGPGKTFPHISITDILNDKVPAEMLADKIVMIGATAVGIYDLRVTPFGSVFPGLEIHANVVSSVLQNRFIIHPAWGAVFDLIAIVAAGLGLGLVLAHTGVIAGGITAFTLGAVFILFCQYMFSSQGLVLNLVYPVTVLILSYTAITGYKYLSESHQKKFIKDAFSSYLAPTVVKQLIDSPETLSLGGEERTITAFFSDVQGFTSISEKLTPHELVELLNEFLTEMTDVILEHGGMVDKFEGDAIIAMFGAPIDLENQAEVACMACIDMQTRLEKMRAHWSEKGQPELHMRIGLCTGPAVVGNMGSKSRMDYTMMGDTVNIAARLEGVNKVYGIYTLISDSTRQDAGDSIVTREIDSINVVGKAVPINVYEILGYQGSTDSNLLAAADQYTKGLYAYRNQEWNRAIIHFNTTLDILPEDGPSRTMLARCNNFKKTPPPKNWNGASTMTSK